MPCCRETESEVPVPECVVGVERPTLPSSFVSGSLRLVPSRERVLQPSALQNPVSGSTHIRLWHSGQSERPVIIED
jgi:hypothetical protein